MKEHPILFSGPMVRAILEGRKAQTRRPIIPQPDHCHRDIIGKPEPWAKEDWNRLLPQIGDKEIRCLFGKPGDRLWVRETWQPCAKGALAIPGVRIIYRADDEAGHIGSGWKPSIHMPRWASRITLEVTDVRVQRVQEISEEDARAEGITDGGCLNCGNPEPCGCPNATPSPSDAFVHTWDAIYAKQGYGWHANPWVWCVSFRRVL